MKIDSLIVKYAYPMRFTVTLLLTFWVSIGSCYGQNILSFNDYIGLVKENHPVAQQVNLMTKNVDANRMMARGQFDPKIEASSENKRFEGSNYFQLNQAKVKVPTWFGIELNAGFESANGIYTDNSDNLPDRGIWNAGFSVPLAKNFLIDERRAAIKQAKVFARATEQEQILAFNDLLQVAADVYIDWQYNQELLKLAINGVDLAFNRWKDTKSSFIQGDKPAIDTLESYINYVTRESQRIEFLQELENARLAVENLLWRDGYIPQELEIGVQPDSLNQSFLQGQMDSLSLIRVALIASHPELILYDTKVESLQIDNRLQRESLKPDLRVQFNPLLATNDQSLFAPYNANNYKWGASLSYPLLLRKERGKIRMTNIKIETTQLDAKIKEQSIIQLLDTYENTVQQTIAKNELLNTNIDNYFDLLRAERRKFDIGESSVFLLNSRETKYLESQQKLLGGLQKLLQSRVIYLYYTGGLFQTI